MVVISESLNDEVVVQMLQSFRATSGSLMSFSDYRPTSVSRSHCAWETTSELPKQLSAFFELPQVKLVPGLLL